MNRNLPTTMKLPSLCTKSHQPIFQWSTRRTLACWSCSWVGFFALLSLAPAQDTTWTGGAGNDNWQEAGNWSAGLPDNLNDDAIISNGDSVVLDSNGPALPRAQELQIFGSSDLIVSGGVNLVTANIQVGEGGLGSMTVTGSGTTARTLSGKSDIFVGFGGNGTLNIADGAVVTTTTQEATEFILGYFGGTGTLNLEGTDGNRGILETNRIGTPSTSSGFLNFDGGVLRALQNSTLLIANNAGLDVSIEAGGAFIDTNGFNVSIERPMDGTGGLTKQGAGTLTLTQPNTFSGGTTVAEGTLSLGTTGSVNDSSGIDIASGATFDVSGLAGGFTLGAAQTLSGHGTILGNVTTAGTLAPGSSTGEFQFTGDLLLDSVAIIEMEIASLSDFDRILVDGMLVYGGTLTLSFLDGYLPEIGDTFDLMQDFSSHSGTFDDIEFLISGYAADFDYSAGQLTITAVPETNTFVFLGISALATAFLGRHRRLSW